MPTRPELAELAANLAQMAKMLAEQPEPDVQARPMPERVLFTPEEAAERLGVGRTTVYGLLRTGDLQSVQIGRLRRIPRDSLDTYAASLTRSNAA